MIRTYKYGQISEDEIFARTESKINVEAIVADIISNVKKEKVCQPNQRNKGGYPKWTK